MSIDFPSPTRDFLISVVFSPCGYGFFPPPLEIYLLEPPVSLQPQQHPERLKNIPPPATSLQRLLNALVQRLTLLMWAALWLHFSHKHNDEGSIAQYWVSMLIISELSSLELSPEKYVDCIVHIVLSYCCDKSYFLLTGEPDFLR